MTARRSGMTTALDTIREYYHRIDGGDVAWVVGLFSTGSSYNRAGVTYLGAEEIKRFFSESRKIRGVHTIRRFITSPDCTTIVAEGRFEGTGEAGDVREVDFTDVWDFGADRLVTSRATYLGIGHAFVER